MDEVGADDEPSDIVQLDFDHRSRRRMVLTTERGAVVLLDMARTVHLRDHDVLRLDDGSAVRVAALDEALDEISGHSAAELVRIAWHLGNRHLPTQITARGLRIRRDHVIEDMVKGLGARIIEIEAPFDPEGGAYAAVAETHDHAAHGHAHHDHGHHGHDHGKHDHAGHDHAKHDHAAHAPAEHVHDEHCGHDHGHHGHSHSHDHK